MMAESDNNHICISALGAVTPLGETLDDVANSLYSRRSGIVDIKKFEVTRFETKWAGIPLHGDKLIRWPRNGSRLRPLPGEVIYADRAIQRLLSEVNPIRFYEPARIGCVIGVDEPALDIQRCVDFLEKRGPQPLDRADVIARAGQYFRLSELLNTDVTSVLRLLHDHIPFAGYSRCHVGLCSASLQALGLALRALRSGTADALIVGGVSAKVTPIQIARLESVGAVCVDRKLTGAQRSRPFDSRRSGFVPAEGAVLFLLEREHAVRRRGGHVYARITGYGSSMGAQHIIAPHTEGLEIKLSMERALADAGIPASAIDCISAHGTSTKLNDLHEARALSQLFAGHSPVVTATKSYHGHLIAAAGAMEVLCTLASFERDFIPPILNLEAPEPEMTLPLAQTVVSRRVTRVLKNSLGMGGLSASLILENPLTTYG